MRSVCRPAFGCVQPVPQELELKLIRPAAAGAPRLPHADTRVATSAAAPSRASIGGQPWRRAGTEFISMQDTDIAASVPSRWRAGCRRFTNYLPGGYQRYLAAISGRRHGFTAREP